MRLRVGVIGLGEAWNTRHRPALCVLSDRFEIRAICAEVSHLAEQAARQFNAISVDGFRALTARSDVDAVLILSQDWVGPLPLLAACEAGKAVYTSAALEIDPDQAREVKDRVQNSGVAFMAELPRRHYPATLRLKELIATKLGKPRLLFCHQRKLLDQTASRRPRGPHCPTDIREMMELVDWCRYIVDREPTSVVGVWHQASDDAAVEEDYQMMSLDFSSTGSTGSGPLAQISCGHYISKAWHEAIAFRPPAALQVCCEQGVAFVDLPSTVTWFDEAGQHLESLDSERPVGEQMLMHFHRAITSLVRKTSDLEDAYRALQVVLASQQSSTENCRKPIVF